MREVVFQKENSQRWQETEEILKKSKQTDPDLLSRLFVQLTDDLAYARTYFPSSKTTAYLNRLVMLAHQQIYVSKKENIHRIYKFFKYDYPLLIHKHYKSLLYALLIFLISGIIGAFSAANDQNFVRMILGDAYVNETLENIDSGKPLAVYSKQQPLPMFFLITLNNIKVALLAFGMGAFLSIGTGFMLLQNGIMLGSFQYFFHSKNLLAVSAMGIWMHGTIEIFSIVVAGAAGLVMGNSILFPGNYKRKDSFQQGAKDGVKLVVGLVPFFIIAGFIESYLTRHSQLEWLSAVIIVCSLILIISYFFIYPVILKNKIWKK